MTTKPALDTQISLSSEDTAVADKLKARAAQKKKRRIVMPPLMAAF
jgi:hypothetical protein